MARTISLRWAGTCRDCGAHLPVGSRARYYGRGRVYGVGCHGRGGGGSARSSVVSTRCEDYPCCGHGPPPMGDGGGCPVRYEDGSERYACVSCGVLMRAGAPSAICGGCRARDYEGGRRDYDGGRDVDIDHPFADDRGI